MPFIGGFDFMHEAQRNRQDHFGIVIWKCLLKSGVSVNEATLTENMSESLLVAQRIVYDSVVNDGALVKV